MGQYWTRKRDQEDMDEKTANPFAEAVSHGNMFFPDPKDGKDEDEEKE